MSIEIYREYYVEVVIRGFVLYYDARGKMYITAHDNLHVFAPETAQVLNKIENSLTVTVNIRSFCKGRQSIII